MSENAKDTRPRPYRECVSLLCPFPAGSLKAVLFDFDHTLSDTRLDFSLLRRRCLEALARYAPVRRDDPGLLLERMSDVLACLDADAAAEAKEAALAAMREVEVEAARRSSLFPYARPILASLRERGLVSAVVTRNCPEAVLAVFPDIHDYCSCVLTRDHVKSVKPDPEHLVPALERAGCASAQALMVGDHPMDIEAGRRAGTRTAAVLTGESGFAELLAAKPDVIAPDASALMRGLGFL
ncbi:MAG: HAD family hydrolase [Desulfovibrio sp.]|jgi:phosphoglycolate phosphatase|nr:HAD family hydrolase [Desulfovibrio sp.]